MRKKRKRLMLGAAFLGIMALAGCGGAAGDTANRDVQARTTEEYVQAAREALEGADGFESGFTAEISMGGSGEVTTKADVAMLRSPLRARVDIHYDFDGTRQDSSVYLEEKADEVNLYMDYDKQWTEMTLSPEDAMNNVQIYNTADNMISLLSAAEQWQIAEQAESEGVITVTATIPEGKVYAVEESGKFFQLAGMSGLSEIYFKDVEELPVEFCFDGKTGRPLSYQMDFAKQLETVTNNVLRELNGGVLENGVRVEQYLISAEITRLGDVETVEIPAAAKSDAINYEREISLLENNAK